MLKINIQLVRGKKFEYDGCHKIYIIENDEQLEEYIETQYSILENVEL